MEPLGIQLYTTSPVHPSEDVAVPATLNPGAVALIIAPRKAVALTSIYLVDGRRWDVADDYDDLARRYRDALAPAPTVAVPEYDGPTGPHGTLEDCRAKTCSYFGHYLVYGGPDLTHEGFHGAETQGAAHMRACARDWANRGPCSVCTDWEARVRA